MQEAPQQGIVKESHLQYQKGQYTKFEKVPFKLCFVLFKLSGCSNVSRAKPRNAAVGNSERMVTSMELDRKTVKKILLIITFGIVLFLGLQNISAVAGVCRTALGMLMPLIIGFCAAFILNVLLKVIEERLFAPLNRKNFRLWSRLRRIVSIILTFGIIIGLVFILIFMIVPELKRAFSLLVENMPQYSMQVKEWITKAAAFLKVDASTLTNLEIDWEKISAAVVDYLKRDSGKLVNTTVGITTSIFSAIFNFILGIVFSVYILMQKEKLGSQATRMLYAFLPQKWAKKSLHIASLSNKLFSRFVTGQCMESVIIGILCFIGMVIFRMPYAPMISVLVGFTALIPIFGAFIGTAIGAFLILMDSPMQAVWFVIFIIVLQQMEGDLIYPRVVGSSVGLPSLWVLLAVTIGGSVWGVLGMLVSVPVCSVLYCLLREIVGTRLAQRGLTEVAAPPEEPPAPPKPKREKKAKTVWKKK